MWLRARRAHLTTAWILAVGVLSTVAGQRSVELPSVFGGGTNGVVWAIFLPLPVVIAFTHGLSSRTHPSEQSAYRNRGAWDAGLLLTMLVSFAAVAAVANVVTAGIPLVAVRNAILLAGAAAAVTALHSTTAASGAVALIVVVTNSIGPTLRGAQYLRIMQSPGDNPWSWTVALAALLTAVVLLVRDRRPALLKDY